MDAWGKAGLSEFLLLTVRGAGHHGKGRHSSFFQETYLSFRDVST